MPRDFATTWQHRLRFALAFCLVIVLPVLANCGDGDVRTLRDILIAPDKVEAVFFTTLANPSAEESAIPVPPLAAGFISAKAPTDATAPLPVVLRTVLKKLAQPETVSGVWHPRNRSSECRKGFVRDRTSAGDLLVLGRYREAGKAPFARELECHVIPRGDPRVATVLSHFGLMAADSRPGVFGLDSVWTAKQEPVDTSGLRKFLSKFDKVSAAGFTPTLRSGSTGIGYTLETLLDIKENNSPRGDFLGIELKSHRGDDFSSTSSKKMNLFLKEPAWLDGLSHKERIPKYGYVDDNGRTALYSTVTSRENSHGLKLTREAEKVTLAFRGKTVAEWDHEILAGRLKEKLRETIFVGAKTRGAGRNEEFHFQTALYCREPSAERLAHLIATRGAMVEMRMHIKETGSARNHGTAFRIRQSSLPQLYRMIVLCRTASEVEVKP
jgi:hypothetical protein